MTLSPDGELPRSLACSELRRAVSLPTREAMKGVIFNLLGDVVQREYGQDTWGAVLDAAELSPDDASPGSYPDEEMASLAKVAAASTRLPTPSAASPCSITTQPPRIGC